MSIPGWPRYHQTWATMVAVFNQVARDLLVLLNCRKLLLPFS
jgi:hypothetical protein